MNILRTLARPLLAAPFIVDGIDALLHPHVHAHRSRDLVDPMEPLLKKAGIEVDQETLVTVSRVMGATSVAAGMGLATGLAPRSGAAILCALSIPVALVHAPTALKTRSFGDVTRRLALVGGLAIASTDRQGNPSAAWRYNAWKDARQAARLAQETTV